MRGRRGGLRRWRGSVVGRTISIVRGGDPASLPLSTCGQSSSFLAVYYASVSVVSLSSSSHWASSLSLASLPPPSHWSPHLISSHLTSSHLISHSSLSSAHCQHLKRTLIAITPAEGRLIALGLSHLAFPTSRNDIISYSNFSPLLLLCCLTHTQSFVYRFHFQTQHTPSRLIVCMSLLLLLPALCAHGSLSQLLYRNMYLYHPLLVH